MNKVHPVFAPILKNFCATFTYQRTHTPAVLHPEDRDYCEMCGDEIPVCSPLLVLSDGSVVCSTTCELNWYEARR